MPLRRADTPRRHPALSRRRECRVSVPPGTPRDVPPGTPRDVPPGTPRDVPPGAPRDVPPGAPRERTVALTVAACDDWPPSRPSLPR